jgi:two-component system, NarL family, invasion response regulator UvrY
MQPTSPDDDDASRLVRLLVVDDDEGIRALLEVSVQLDHRFELAGMAATGAEALAAVAASSEELLDVVLLDVTLPDRDGIELVREVRRVLPNVHVALFTGWSDAQTLQRADNAGADAVFGKDGDPQGLLDRIHALVR